MTLSHVSLTARDALALSSFYQAVFDLVERRPPRRLAGEAVWRGNGLPGVEILVVWLEEPEQTGPFLEIMQYTTTVDRGSPAVNEPGFAHLAFEVADIHETLERVLRFGGCLQGQVTNFGTGQAPRLIVYVRDPEGNILELDQP